jgi:hypothetical protein
MEKNRAFTIATPKVGLRVLRNKSHCERVRGRPQWLWQNLCGNAAIGAEYRKQHFSASKLGDKPCVAYPANFLFAQIV